MMLSQYELNKIGSNAYKITAKAVAVEKLAGMIKDAVLNEDYEAIRMYADVIEQHLDGMLRLVNEIRKIMEKDKVESGGVQK